MHTFTLSALSHLVMALFPKLLRLTSYRGGGRSEGTWERERRGKVKGGAGSGMGRDRREAQRARKMNGNAKLSGIRDRGFSKKFQRPGMSSAPRT